MNEAAVSGIESLPYAGMFVDEDERPSPRPRGAGHIPALPTLAPDMLLPRLSPMGALPFPLDLLSSEEQEATGASRAALYYLARNAIHHGLGALGLGAGDVVLMPAYHHGVEVEAVRSTGARVVFYRVDRSLRADLDDAHARAEGARALYLTHYAGFAQPLDDALALCRERGLMLIEDCALSLLSRDPTGRPLGSTGDLSVFCLYKTLPVPHGGVAVARARLPEGASPPLLSTLRHMLGSLRARAALRGNAVEPLLDGARSLARATVYPLAPVARTGTRHLDPTQLALGASRVVPALLRRVSYEEVVTRRRRNYHLLASLLDGEGARGRPAVSLERGACPLFYPLIVDDKARALAVLASHGIEGVDFWSDGDPACDGNEFRDAAWLRRHLLEVPIHQDLDDEAVERVACAVKKVLRDG